MPQQIASEYISHRVNEGDKENLHGILQYISDGSIKAEFLKEIGMYYEAVDELLREGQYPEAYRILKAQGMFDEGIMKAKDNHSKDMFSLFHARKMYFVSKPSAILTEILKSSDKYIVAQAYCLYALINRDASYYRKAIKAFDECKCDPGKLIAFRGLLALNNGSNVKVEELLQMSRLATQCSKAIVARIEQNSTTLQKRFFREILKVHDIEDGELYYYIPEISFTNPTITGLELDSAFNSKDADGMIMLQRDTVDKILLSYYRELQHSWLSRPDIQDHFIQIIKELNSSTFYRAIQSQSFSKAYDFKLNNYFKEIMSVIEFNALCGPVSDLQGHEMVGHIAVSLFTFLSAIFLRDHGSLNKIAQTLPFSRKYFEDAAYKILENQDASLDDFYLSWNLLVSFAPSIGRLHTVLNERVKENNSLVLLYKRKTHIFFWWLHAYKQIVFKYNINSACQTVFYHILLRLPELVIKRDNVISVATLTYILIILSSSLFVVANTSINSTFYVCPFIVPKLYENLIDSFGGIRATTTIKMACSLQIYSSSNYQQIKTHSIRQLQAFLDFLLGEFHHYSVLRNALSSEIYLNDGSALNCLILCLVLVSNLFAYYEKFEATDKESKNLLQRKLQTIHEELHRCRKSSLTTPTFVQTAYVGLQSANKICDIFKVVVSLLNLQKQLPQMACPLINSDYKVFFHEIHTRDFPQSRIKKLVILENPEETSPMNLPDKTAIHAQSPVIIASEDEIEEPDEDEVIIDPSPLTSDVVEGEVCLACGVKLHDNDMRRSNQILLVKMKKQPISHLETKEHLQKVEEYKKWKEELESTNKMHLNLVDLLEKQEEEHKLVKYRSLYKQSQSKYNLAIKEMEKCQQGCDWRACIGILQTYKDKIMDWLKEVEILKEQVEISSGNNEDNDETIEVELLPQYSEEAIWSKKSKK